MPRLLSSSQILHQCLLNHRAISRRLFVRPRLLVSFVFPIIVYRLDVPLETLEDLPSGPDFSLFLLANLIDGYTFPLIWPTLLTFTCSMSLGAFVWNRLDYETYLLGIYRHIVVFDDSFILYSIQVLYVHTVNGWFRPRRALYAFQLVARSRSTDVLDRGFVQFDYLPHRFIYDDAIHVLLELRELVSSPITVSQYDVRKDDALFARLKIFFEDEQDTGRLGEEPIGGCFLFAERQISRELGMVCLPECVDLVEEAGEIVPHIPVPSPDIQYMRAQ